MRGKDEKVYKGIERDTETNKCSLLPVYYMERNYLLLVGFNLENMFERHKSTSYF